MGEEAGRASTHSANTVPTTWAKSLAESLWWVAHIRPHWARLLYSLSNLDRLGHYRPRNSFLRHDGHGLRCRAPPIPIGPVGRQTLPENPDDAATIPRGANGIFRSVGPMGCDAALSRRVLTATPRRLVQLRFSPRRRQGKNRAASRKGWHPRRARIRPPSPSSRICCGGDDSRSPKPPNRRPKWSAPRRRRPTKPIPTNCDGKEDIWCCAAFVSTAGSLTIENGRLAPV
jgi:hypothetical protein